MTQDEATPPFEGPLFIVGLPRSGTKLLRDLANGHSRIAIPVIETEFLPHLAEHRERWSDLHDPERFRALHETLRSSPYFRLMERAGWGVDAETWFRACREHSLAGVFEALLRLQLDAPPGSGILWGDKSPSHIRHTLLLKQLFPRARILHIVRDGRDQALSAHRAWGTSLMRAAQRWSDGVCAMLDDAPALGNDYLQVRYEQLLENPEHEMRRVASFLDLDFEPGMTRLTRSMEREGDAGGWTEVKRDNAGKYLTALPPRTRGQLESLAAEGLRRYGYPLPPDTVPRRLPGALMAMLQGLDGARFVRISVRDVGWRGALGYAWARYATSGNRVRRPPAPKSLSASRSDR